MASIISAGTTSGTSLNLSADTSGQLELKTGSGPTTAITISSAQLTTIANDATISGLTVGKGGGAVATNTVVGLGALGSNTTGLQNTVFGNQSGSTATGSYFTAVGFQAGFKNTESTFGNSFIGRYAGYNNTTGANNTVCGGSGLYTNTTGSSNTALGVETLYSNTTASGNTAVGMQAGYAVTTSYSNVFIGYQTAAQSTTTGYENAIVGYQSAFSLTSGNHNCTLGFQAGSTITNGNGNVMLGKNTQPTSGSGSDQTCIGANLTGKGNNTAFIGGTAYNGANTSTWATTSDRRLKKNIVDNNDGIDKITAIQVRNFEYRTAEEVTELPEHTVIKKEGVQLGVIAQEIAQVLPECVKEETTGVLRVDTDNLTWYLINAVKELNAKVEAQAAEIAALKGAK